MLDLLNGYTVTEIIIFLIAFATAFKGVVTFWDWAMQRGRQFFNKKTEADRVHEDLKAHLSQIDEKIEKLIKHQDQNYTQIKDLYGKIDLLILSDKDDIKAYITDRHHYYCYELECIDDYSLDCIEKRYSHYIAEGGNSFVETLMIDLRKLPRK